MVFCSYNAFILVLGTLFSLDFWGQRTRLLRPDTSIQRRSAFVFPESRRGAYSMVGQTVVLR